MVTKKPAKAVPQASGRKKQKEATVSATAQKPAKAVPQTSGRKKQKEAAIPSIQALEKALSTRLGNTPLQPVQQAQEVMYDAWECDDPKTRIQLAFKALMISRNCADAYVLLAEETAEIQEEALAYYTLGTLAGERALGKRAFKEDAGYFWGLIETRPYMRAREGLAATLRTIGALELAADHYREMLRLNPNDNQGIRYELAATLLELGEDKPLAELLERYEKDFSADWCYTRALLSFRREGDSEAAGRLLDQALEANGHVSRFLLGKKKLPRKLPEYYGMGDENEAINFVMGFSESWRSTPHALNWLAKRTKEKP